MKQLIDAAKAVILWYENNHREWDRKTQSFPLYNKEQDNKEIANLREALKDAEEYGYPCMDTK